MLEKQPKNKTALSRRETMSQYAVPIPTAAHTALYRAGLFWRLLGIAALGLLLASTPSQAGVPQRETVAVRYLEFPPYSFTNAEDQPDGSIIRLTRRLLMQAGYPADIRSAPSARLYGGLADGSIHLWPGAPGVPQLKGLTLESRYQVAEVNLNLYHRSGTPPPVLPEDLRGKRIILLTGYTYRPPVSDWLKDPQLGIKPAHTSSHASALAMLALHRGEYLIDYQSPVERELRARNQQPLPFITLHRLPIKLIISRAAPNSQQLRDDLDRAYESLRAAGEDLSL